MKLEYKPDLDRTQTYWKAFWNREIIDRPCVFVTAPRYEGRERVSVPYMAGYEDGGTYRDALAMFDEWAALTYFGGEAIPSMDISFGPDQFSGFLGAELAMAEDRRTSWAVPFVAEWKTVKLELDTSENSLWNEMLECLRVAARYSEGKFLINMLDIHSNLDCLGAIRGAEKLCLDIVDRPDEIERMMEQVRPLYVPVYEGVYEPGEMERRGTIGWAPFYCEGRFATIQCDYICLISPEQSRRFVIPALEEEASYLDHCVYHLDGPGALPHLDDILAIPGIDVIQWVTGAGNPPIIEWIELLKKIQRAGRGLEINASPEEVKVFHRELCPEGVLYRVRASSVREAESLLLWLAKNT